MVIVHHRSPATTGCLESRLYEAIKLAAVANSSLILLVGAVSVS